MITGQYTTPDGAVHPNAVGRIAPITVQTVPGYEGAQFRLEIWINQAAMNAGKQGYQHNFSSSGQDFMARYAAGAEACYQAMGEANTIQDKMIALETGLLYPCEMYILEQPEFAGWTRI